MTNTETHKDYLQLSKLDIEGHIDDKTCSDLEIDRLFKRVDITNSLPGRSVLYCWLRRQCVTSQRLNVRTRLIDSWEGFQQSDAVRNILVGCGFQNQGSLAEEICNPVVVPGGITRLLLILWLLVSTLAFASPFLLGKVFLLYAVLPVAVINIGIHFKWHFKIAPHYGSICYLQRVLRCSRRLVEKLPENLSDERETLIHINRKVRRMSGNSVLFLNPSGMSLDLLNSILDYFRVFFLAEVISFILLYRNIASYQQELKELFRIIGEIDASLSISKLKAQEKALCVPRLCQDRREVQFKRMIHPLIDQCVENSAAFDKGVILTGSNMAGKSTFLRMLGLNQVLATTINCAFADELNTSFLRVISSIQVIDDLSSKQSHYYVESQRLFEIWELVKVDETQWLVLIDEVLSGTNSTDRNMAVTSILGDMKGSSSLIVVTTHELDIAHHLASSFDNYHFSEAITDGQLVFDYLLKPGIVERSNALMILKHVGFPNHIISKEPVAERESKA